MITNWNYYFDNYGIKKVTSTDKNKKAYVLNDDQHAVVIAAGLTPASVRPTPTIKLTVLFDKHRNSVRSGFYHAVRSDEANRTPEARMGKELISTWLDTDDEVLIGNIGAQLFALKLAAVPASDKEIALEIAKHR